MRYRIYLASPMASGDAVPSEAARRARAGVPPDFEVEAASPEHAIQRLGSIREITASTLSPPRPFSVGDVVLDDRGVALQAARLGWHDISRFLDGAARAKRS